MEVIRKGFLYCGTILLSVIVYYIIAQLSLNFISWGLDTYQGINEMGQISLGELPSLVKKAYADVIKLPIRDYNSVAPIPLVRLLYLLLGIMTAWMLGIIWISNRQQPMMNLLSLGLCAVYPLAVNFIVIMVPKGTIYTLMLYAFVMLPVAVLTIYEQVPKTQSKMGRKILSQGLAVAFSALIFSYIYYDNVNTTCLFYATYQTENYQNAIVTQVRMAEGYTPDKKWAILGDFSDPTMVYHWEPLAEYGGQSRPRSNMNNFARYYWFWNLLGYDFQVAKDAEIAELMELEEVQAMPTWPSQGSIKVINEFVVIKCQEISEINAE